MSSVLEYEPTVQMPHLPVSVGVLAWLHIAFGVLAAVDVGYSLANNRLNINLMILSVFIGRGLLCRSQMWRAHAALTPVPGHTDSPSTKNLSFRSSARSAWAAESLS